MTCLKISVFLGFQILPANKNHLYLSGSCEQKSRYYLYPNWGWGAHHLKFTQPCLLYIKLSFSLPFFDSVIMYNWLYKETIFLGCRFHAIEPTSTSLVAELFQKASLLCITVPNQGDIPDMGMWCGATVSGHLSDFGLWFWPESSIAVRFGSKMLSGFFCFLVSGDWLAL